LGFVIILHLAKATIGRNGHVTNTIPTERDSLFSV